MHRSSTHLVSLPRPTRNAEVLYSSRLTRHTIVRPALAATQCQSLPDFSKCSE